MYLKKTMQAVLCIGTLCGPVAYVAGESESDLLDLKLSVTLTQDYRSKGISETNGKAALQSGIEVAALKYFYVGAWASTVEQKKAAFLTIPGDAETDIYGGVKIPLTESLIWNTSITRYGYADKDSTYWEGYSGLILKELIASGDLSFGATYSSSYSANDGKFFYPRVDYFVELPILLSLNLHLGYNNFSSTTPATPADITGNYLDWQAELSVNIIGFTLSAAFTGTNIDSNDQCGVGNAELCKTKLIFSLSKRFF